MHFKRKLSLFFFFFFLAFLYSYILKHAFKIDIGALNSVLWLHVYRGIRALEFKHNIFIHLKDVIKYDTHLCPLWDMNSNPLFTT